MTRNLADPGYAAVFHRRVGVQPTGHGFADDGLPVCFQFFDDLLFFFDKGINTIAAYIDIICYYLSFILRWVGNMNISYNIGVKI